MKNTFQKSKSLSQLLFKALYYLNSCKKVFLKLFSEISHTHTHTLTLTTDITLIEGELMRRFVNGKHLACPVTRHRTHLACFRTYATTWFTKNDEWIKEDGGVLTLGITNYAQEALGDMTFVDLPKVGQEFEVGECVCAVESVKAASDINIPVDGTTIETNEALADSPELVNQDPEGEGWLIKFESNNVDGLQTLMSAEDYKEYCSSRKQ